MTAVTRSARLFVPGKHTWLALSIYLSILVAWETIIRTGIIASDYIPSAWQIIIALFNLVQQAEYWWEVAATLYLWGSALLVATGVGIVVGIAMGWSNTIGASLNVVVEGLRPVPTVALIPLAVLLYGTGLKSAFFLAVIASLWPILIQTIYGIKATDTTALDMARSFRLPRIMLLRYVLIPSAAPSIVSGIHTSSAISLILVVTTGIVVGTPGIGESITRAANGGAFAQSYAFVVTAGLLGILLHTVLAQLLVRTLAWVPGHRKEAQ